MCLFFFFFIMQPAKTETDKEALIHIGIYTTMGTINYLYCPHDTIPSYHGWVNSIISASIHT